MLTKSKIIIVLTKDKVYGTVVDLKAKKIVKSIELGWTSETLELALGQLKKELKILSARILFGQEVSYVVKFEIPGGLQNAEERKYISQKMSEKIPEALTDSQWDYKELRFKVSEKTGEGSETKDVIVFSPVGNVLKVLEKAILTVGIEVEAMEPEEIAKTRDSNPIVGLALKEDIKGSDAGVLNIKPESKEEMEKEAERRLTSMDSSEIGNMEVVGAEPEKEVKYTENRPNKFRKIIILLLLLLFPVLAAIFILFSFRRPTSTTSEKSVVTGVVSLSPSPTLTPEPTVTQINISEIKIQVQNGSGIKGEADYAAGILKEAGFEIIETGNADSYGYQETIVRLTSGLSDEVFIKLSEALEATYVIASESGELEEYAVVIIVGRRK